MNLTGRFPKSIDCIPFIVINSTLWTLEGKLPFFNFWTKVILANFLHLHFEVIFSSGDFKFSSCVLILENLKGILKFVKSWIDVRNKIFFRDIVFRFKSQTSLTSLSCTSLLLLLSQMRISFVNIRLFSVICWEITISMLQYFNLWLLKYYSEFW